MHRAVTAGHSTLARAFQCPGRGTGFFSSSVCLIRVAPGVAAVLAAGLFLAGCGDADLTDPVEISSEETVASLQFNGQLPVLPVLVDRWKGGNALADLSREWRTSWELPPGEAEEGRQEIRAAVSHLLADRADGESISRVLADLDRLLDRVDHLLGGDFPAHLAPTLGSAREERDLAHQALGEGDEQGALLHVMTAADRLHATSPETLASEILNEAEETFRRVQGVSSYEEEERRRVERLLIGSRTAFDDGAHILALRRAWYAVRLMDERGEP